MSSVGSVSYWIEQLKEGDRAAVQNLWEGYFRRLVALARARLQGVPRQAADEEDVALSAFKSFCLAAEAGRFPRLEDRDDLWQILMMLAHRKVIDLRKREGAEKRGRGKVVLASALAGADDADGPLFAGIIGRDPDPGVVAEMTEQAQRLLGHLGDEQLRQIAVWKMEGFTNEEIAVKIARSLATVERKLALIRETWASAAEQDD